MRSLTALLLCCGLLIWLGPRGSVVPALASDSVPGAVSGSRAPDTALDTGTLADQVPRLTPEQRLNPHLSVPGGSDAVTRKQLAVTALQQEDRARYARVDEKTGTVIPQNIVFRDENGQQVNIADLLDMPVVIAPVYYSCPGACHLLLSSLARILPQVDLVPGKDYRVVAVSFDDTDTPKLAARRKQDFMAAMDFAYPAEAWAFLSGDAASVDTFMDAIGFRYRRIGKDFIHPTMLLVTAPGGVISRYLYGQGFMPFDLTMSLHEAAQGKVGLSLKRMLSYCFTYDPANRRYVFDFMRLAGGIILFGAAVLLFVLLRGGKRRRRTTT